MYRKMIVSVVFLCALMALPLTGDTSNAAMSASKSNPAALPGPAQTDESATLDDRFTSIAREVPGFGGMFFDQDGTLQVYIVGQRGPAPDALMASLDNAITREIGGGERLSRSGIEIREGKYSFLELQGWQQQITPEVLTLPDVVSTDIADHLNKLEIGITDTPGMKETVEGYLAKLGIPHEAAVISEAKLVFPELRSRRRPIRGGLQINFGGFLCTLGFVAVRQGITGFVTNSHCTNTQGGVEGTVYHQPSASGTTNRIGQEIADPTYFTGGQCPAGRRCRFSDSSFARVPHPSGPSVTTALGTIARPPVGSFTWNGVDTFTITAEAARW